MLDPMSDGGFSSLSDTGKSDTGDFRSSDPQTPPIFETPIVPPYDPNAPPPYLTPPQPIRYILPPPVLIDPEPQPISFIPPPAMPPQTIYPLPMNIDEPIDTTGRVISPMPPIYMNPSRIATDIGDGSPYNLPGGGVGMIYNQPLDTSPMPYNQPLDPSLVFTLVPSPTILDNQPSPLPPIFVTPDGTVGHDSTQTVGHDSTQIIVPVDNSGLPPAGTVPAGGTVITPVVVSSTPTGATPVDTSLPMATPVLFAGLQDIESLIKDHPYILLAAAAGLAYFIFADK